MSLTNEQIVEQVIANLRIQGRQAFDSKGGTCKYRTLDGAACAIGGLISDELATLADEQPDPTVSCAVTTLPALADFFGVKLEWYQEWTGESEDEDEGWNILADKVSERKVDFLGKIQTIHDDVDNWNPWGLKVDAVAKLRSLLTGYGRGLMVSA